MMCRINDVIKVKNKGEEKFVVIRFLREGSGVMTIRSMVSGDYFDIHHREVCARAIYMRDLT